MNGRIIVGLALLGLSSVAAQPATTGPANGTLILVGGGANRPAFMEPFVKLAGGADASASSRLQSFTRGTIASLIRPGSSNRYDTRAACGSSAATRTT
jgi:hypothetical protein